MAAPVAFRHHDEEYAKYPPVVLHGVRVAEFLREGKAAGKKDGRCEVRRDGEERRNAGERRSFRIRGRGRSGRQAPGRVRAGGKARQEGLRLRTGRGRSAGPGRPDEGWEKGGGGRAARRARDVDVRDADGRRAFRREAFLQTLTAVLLRSGRLADRMRKRVPLISEGLFSVFFMPFVHHG